MQSFYRLRTRSSRQLGIDPAGQLRSDPVADRPVVLLRPHSQPAFGFLFVATAPDTPVVVNGIGVRTAVQPWRVRRGEAGLALLDPAFGAVLAEREEGMVGLRPWDETAEAAAVQLEPVEFAEITPVMARMADLLAAVLPANLNGPDLLDTIANGLTPATAELFQAVFRLLPRDQVAWLGGTMLGLPMHLERVAAAFPGDIWASRALPELRAWLHMRRGPTLGQLPPEWDFLAAAGLNGHMVTAGHVLNAAARASIPPRRPACVVATARNEGLYLLEWIAYHRLVGAEAVFIYSNDNSDGSDDLLRALAQAGEITWIENKLEIGRGAQPKAYGHAFSVLPGVLDYRWSLVIDLDEFFGFDTARFRSLPDYIDWQETQPVDAVALNWLVFGSSERASWTDEPLVERFTRRLPWIDAHIKSLSRTNRLIQSHPHHAVFNPHDTVLTRDSEGAPYRFKDGFSFAADPRSDKAWISHYFLKSAEEFIWKFSRNRGDHALVRELDPTLIERNFASMFLAQHQSPTMVEDPRTVACAPRPAPAHRGVAQPPRRAGGRKPDRRLVFRPDRAPRRHPPQQPALQAADSPFPQLARFCR